ncbi:MAG TPA: MerR family transcriptional regulator [Isosphaeraceae bacterium]|nr:MerR family transcriptional regulator [Isosphaeraceae bacterium]
MDTRIPSEPDRSMSPAPESGRDEESPPEAIPKSRYSIAAVSKLTGISCHTLRVWERRYGFPVPERSASGHRRYTQSQVEILCRLTELNRTRRQPIGELIERLSAPACPPGQEPVSPEQSSDEAIWTELVRHLLQGDYAGAEREYASLASRCNPSTLVERVIYPAVVEAGEGWYRHSCSVYQERLITIFLWKKLNTLIIAADAANVEPVRSVIAGTVQGDRHEGGVLILNHAMSLRGWKVHNLGVDLPVSEFAAAVETLRPTALALSFVLSRNITRRFQELERIQAVPVFVGGRSILNYQSLARHHGLIPLIGPISKSADQLQVETDRWYHERDRAGEAGTVAR